MSVLPVGALGLNDFNHPWTYQVNCAFPPPALVPKVQSKILAENVTSQLGLLFLVALCWMEATLFPKVLNILEEIPHWCPIVKDLIIDVSVTQVFKGLQLLHLTLWLLRDVCCTDKGSLP